MTVVTSQSGEVELVDAAKQLIAQGSDNRLNDSIPVTYPSLTELMDDADERLFHRIMNNTEHVLQPFLPDRPVLPYNLRRRRHCNKSLITKTVDLSNNDYIIRATYKDSY